MKHDIFVVQKAVIHNVDLTLTSISESNKNRNIDNRIS